MKGRLGSWLQQTQQSMLVRFLVALCGCAQGTGRLGGQAIVSASVQEWKRKQSRPGRGGNRIGSV